jgi:hypothetical protein
MIDRRTIDKTPTEAERLAWCDWLRHHTIDPDHVVANPEDGGFIEIDTEARQIRFMAYDVNDKGNYYLASDGKRASISVRVVQLESRPSPFPDFRPYGWL